LPASPSGNFRPIILVQTLSSLLQKYKYLFFGLTLFVFLLPAAQVRQVVGMDHWTGTIHAFEYFFLNGFQFGTDIIDNVGPYGFLHYPYFYSGESFLIRPAAFLFLLALYSFFSVALLQRIKGLFFQILSLLCLAYFPLQDNFPPLSYEIIPRLTIFLSAIYFLDRKKHLSARPYVPVIIVSFFYALISLQKTSNTFLIIILLLVVFAWYARTKDFKFIAVFSLSYLGFLVSLWTFAGQRLSLLPQFFQSSFQFSLAYQEAMDKPLSPVEYKFAVITALIILCFVLLRLIASLRSKRVFIEEISYSFIFSLCVFLSWKHAMVYGGMHQGIYFEYLGCVGPYLFFHRIDSLGLSWDKFRIRKWKTYGYLSMPAGITAICAVLYFLFVSSPDLHRSYPLNVFWEGKQRLKSLMSYNIWKKKEELDGGINELIHNNRLPEKLRIILGDGKVDEFGNEPQILLVNDLNYRPRPIPVLFISVSPKFLSLNQSYYSQPGSAPRHIFADIASMGLRDSGAFLELMRWYEPVERFGKWLILGRRSNPKDMSFSKSASETINFDQNIDVPEWAEATVWCKINVRYNRTGQIRKLLYKPPVLTMVLSHDDNTENTIRVIPMSLEFGFVVSPIINNNDDLMRFYGGKRLKRAKRIRVNYSQFHENDIEITFHKIGDYRVQ